MYTPRYIDAEDLAALIKSAPKADAASEDKRPFAVVDVRDDDFRGGNIVACRPLPSREHNDKTFDELTTELKDKDRVIFHCALSQVRGPKAARKYAETLEKKSPESKQEILILREGFGGFQQKYRHDSDLVEKFIKSCWD